MKKLINDGWEFAKLPCGSSLKDTQNASFSQVDLPHDWLIWQENDLYESADAWYRRVIRETVSEGETVFLRFDGVYMDCDVILNGEILYTHPYGYTAFDVPLTGRLLDGDNLLMVHIRHRSPNSRWYSGSGIYRDVYLITLPDDHLIPDGIMIREQEDGEDWLLEVTAETSMTSGTAFICRLEDLEGRRVAAEQGIREGQSVRALLRIPSAECWSTDHPYLYQLIMEYGKQTEIRKIGLRSVSLDPDQGFFLNHRKIKLHGVCLHHDLGALGAAFHEKAARRQLNLMKRMGANAIRTSHNPPASVFLDLCDELGLLVVDEAFDMWEKSKTEYDYARFFPEWAFRDVASWIRRDRCHPCVIMWSVGNEIYDMHAGPRGAEITRQLAQTVRENDPGHHAAVTFGCNYMPWKGGQRCAAYVDAVGYNYGEKLYDSHHAEHPGWVIYGSETSSILSSRGIYHFPISQSIMAEADQQCSALGNSNTSWGAENLEKLIIGDLLNSYSLGQFIWSGIDYIGEPTPYHTRSCYFGQADTACYPKDSFYLFQSYWSKEKTVHIGVSWDWNHGQIIDVPVMTGYPAAELFLNDRSLGLKKRDPLDPGTALPVWRVPFEPGTLTARAYDREGNAVCEDIRRTPGEPDRLILSSENDCLLSDGWDIAFITVTAVDAAMIPVDNARERVQIDVTGGGCLMGTDNGDSADPDGYKSSCRRLFSGKLLLIIGSTGQRKDTRICVTGRQCRGASLVLPYREADPVPGRSRIQRIPKGTLSGSIAARRIDILALESNRLTPEHPSCSFRYTVLPQEADCPEVAWEITNQAGIPTPFMKAEENAGLVTVTARCDGFFYLRALGSENGRVSILSQMELYVSGFGNLSLNPYEYIPAGLYDLREGEIGTGNEKGIAFSRDGFSMAGFSSVDFGSSGSDRLTADLFALDGDPYDIELFCGDPRHGGRLITVLNYQKPSIWNVYQAETWTLPERLTGIRTICFRMKQKIHMKGFCFERQFSAFRRHSAASADLLYGDSFRKTGEEVRDIGNNVTLVWNELEFDRAGEFEIEIAGTTTQSLCSIHILIRDASGAGMSAIADFRADGGFRQRFSISVPGTCCSVSFVFLPGSRFNFSAFCFQRSGKTEQPRIQTGQNDKNRIK